ncbi:hypothetical protein [Salinimicrobium soli]|uniref:hypothetical protein n=1 Tax=Salinimicrobium soli TaxID=1254399 RepID=UPI003AADED70
MTKKEEMPKKNKDKRERKPEGMPYNPDITSEDKEVLNNQSKDEKKGEYFKDRNQPIDYTGSDLDIPKMDDKQFNETRNKADESEKNRKPKESANSNDNIEAQSDTVYKGEEAEKYKDPSKKGNKEK